MSCQTQFCNAILSAVMFRAINQFSPQAFTGRVRIHGEVGQNSISFAQNKNDTANNLSVIFRNPDLIAQNIVVNTIRYRWKIANALMVFLIRRINAARERACI